MTQQPYDPWAIASNPPEDPKSFYGQVTIKAWACMWVPNPALGINAKGEPKKEKLPYDPNVMDANGQPYRPSAAVDLTIEPLEESKLQFSLQRSMQAEFGEWKDVTWPSLKALNVLNAQEIGGKFVRIEQVPTGRTYTNGNGETKQALAIKFTDIYPDRATCLNAYFTEFGKPTNSNGNGHTPAQAPAAAPANGNGNGAERETALKFAKAFVQNAMREAAKDLDKARDILGPKMAAQPVIAKYFTVDSPEVMEMMLAETV